MAWALDGFHAVILRQGGAADIAAPCVKLLALAPPCLPPPCGCITGAAS